MKKNILLFTYLLAVFFLNAQTKPVAMVAKMKQGLNLGNVFSAPSEGEWSPVVHQQYFNDLRNSGFKNVRIPVDFFGNRTTGNTNRFSKAAGTQGQYNGSSGDYVVSRTYLNRLDQVINWGLNAGLIVTLDFHGATLKNEFIKRFDSTEASFTQPTSARRAADNDKFRSIWRQIAYRFKFKSENLLFEIINEPYFHMSEGDMNKLNTDVLNIIRNSGGPNKTRNIIITGGTARSHLAPLRIAKRIIDNDNYLIATFHYYQPFPFTASSRPDYNKFTWGTAAEIALLRSDFDEVKDWSRNNRNIPILLGEFSADNKNGIRYNTGVNSPDGGPQNASRIKFHKICASAALARGFSFAAWDGGNKDAKSVHLRTDNPNTNNAVAGTWVLDVRNALLEGSTCTNKNINFNNFETDLGIWTLGASDAARLKTNNNNRENAIDLWSVRLRDNSGSSILTTRNINLSNYENINVDFSFITKSFDSRTERFQIQISTNGGQTYDAVKTWNLIDEFRNNQRNSGHAHIKRNFTAQTRIRIKCIATDDNDFLYLDNIKISGCKKLISNKVAESKIKTKNLNEVESDLSSFDVFPNPAEDFLTVKLAPSSENLKHINIIDTRGRIINKYNINSLNNTTINISNIKNGIYFIQVTKNDNSILKLKKIILRK